MRVPVLVISTTYPRFEGDNFAPFVRTLCASVVSSFPVTITVVASGDRRLEAGYDEEVDGISVVRYNYWFRKYQRFAYGDAILSNMRRTRSTVIQAIPFVSLMFLTSALQIIKKRPALIHAHWTLPCGLVAVLLGRFFRIPVMVTSHGGDVYGITSGWGRRLLRWVFTRADLVTAVSTATADEIRSICKGKTVEVRVQPMGVEHTKFHPQNVSVTELGLDESTRLILFVGRLSEVKGVSYLIEAMPLVLEQRKDVVAWLVGSGNLEAALKQQVADLGLGETVVFKGHISNRYLPSYYAAAALLVQPSIPSVGGREGLPVTIIEALMSHTRVVASALGGIVDVGESSMVSLVPPGNSDALAREILRVIDTPVVPDDFERRFHIEKVAENFYDMYGALTDSRASGPGDTQHADTGKSAQTL